MEAKTQTELEKRIEELVLFSGCVSGDCPHEKWSDCAEHYQKLIKEFILEMPEVKEVVEALVAAKEEMDNYGYCDMTRIFNALSKLRELGVV